MTTTKIDNSGLNFPDGTFQVTASNSMKNRIINGNFNIDQKKEGRDKYSVSLGGTSTDIITLDRWRLYAGGFQTVSIKRENQDASLYNFPHCLSMQQEGGTSGKSHIIYQKIESIFLDDIGPGQVMHLSAQLSANNSAWQTVSWALYGRPYNRDSWVDYGQTLPDFINDFTVLANGIFNITSTPTTYQAQITMPSTGPQGGTFNWAKNGLLLAINPNAISGTLPYYTNSVQNLNANFKMSGVQLEKGSSNGVSTATTFDYRPISEELRLCERYCYTMTPSYGAGNMIPAVSVIDTANNAGNPVMDYGLTLKFIPNVPMYVDLLNHQLGGVYGSRGVSTYIFDSNTSLGVGIYSYGCSNTATNDSVTISAYGANVASPTIQTQVHVLSNSFQANNVYNTDYYMSQTIDITSITLLYKSVYRYYYNAVPRFFNRELFNTTFAPEGVYYANPDYGRILTFSLLSEIR